MIDTKELRRLAQAATPGPWINHGRQPNVAGLPHSAVAAKTLLARVYSEAYGDVEQETANASFIAAANPAAVSELLDRLEAAKSDALEQARLNGMGSEREAKHLAQIAALEKERDALRAELGTIGAKVPAEYCAYSKDWRESDTAGRIDWLIAMYESVKEDRDALSAELDELKGQRGEVVYRWLALDYSGFCYGSSPPDNLPNHCNLKAFYAPAEVAP